MDLDHGSTSEGVHKRVQDVEKPTDSLKEDPILYKVTNPIRLYTRTNNQTSVTLLHLELLLITIECPMSGHCPSRDVT